MQFHTLRRRAREIRRGYAALEQAKYGRSWTSEELALGFVGDVGDLMKWVAAANGVRDVPDLRQKLEHELADCLWSVIVLADAHGVDLERAFMRTMDELEQHISPYGETRGAREEKDDGCAP